MFEQVWLPGLLDENWSLEDRSHVLDVSNVVSCERTVAWTLSAEVAPWYRHRLFSSLLPMLQSAVLSSLLHFSDLACSGEMIDAIVMPARYLWLPPAAVIRGLGGLLVKLSASSAPLHVATMRLITRWKISAIVRRSDCYIGELSQCLCCLCSTPIAFAIFALLQAHLLHTRFLDVEAVIL